MPKRRELTRTDRSKVKQCTGRERERERVRERERKRE
jgi:hypothetical protein